MLGPTGTDGHVSAGSVVDKAIDTLSLSNLTRTFALLQARLSVAIPSCE